MGWIDKWLKKPDRAVFDGSLDAVKGVDRFDREDVERIRDEMRDFRIAEDSLADIADTAAHLASDTFHGFHKVDSEVEDADRMRPSYLVNQMVAKELHSSPEFERLRPWTEGDLVNAAMAFVTMTDDLKAFYDKAKTKQKEAEALEQKMQELLDNLDTQRDLDQMMEDWKDGPPDELTPEQVQQILDAIQEAQDQLDQEQGDLEQEIGDQGNDLEQGCQNVVRTSMPGLRQSMKEAADDAEELQAMATTYGTDPGVLQKMSAAERIELAERFASNPNFEYWAELIGMMQRIAIAEQTRKVYHSFEEVYDVGMGNDLGRLVPSELLGLMNPATKLNFYNKFTEGKLLQYEMRGNEKVGRGGIICAMDNSGSMRYPTPDKERFAKGIGGASMSIAREQKRSFYGIHFSSAHEIETFDFRKPEDMTIHRVMDYFEHFFNGGTDFERPLAVALKVLQEEEAEKGFVEGDIIFITDGESYISDPFLKAFLAEKERLGFKVWGMLIGGIPKVLRQFADHVMTISDLLNPERDVREMFRDL